MTSIGYVTKVCLLIITYTTFNVAPILLLLYQIQEGNNNAVVSVCIFAMVTAFISVGCVIASTLYCVINFPDTPAIMKNKAMPALSQ